ncbi:MAG: rhomboid family intramembrane serine protease [Acidobacteria bacterium]|nr:rhomboid family intramembrane serine protease [Acidobacteriota bacterium]
MDKRRMCPHCRAFITTDDRVCPYCNSPVGPRAIDRRQPADIMGGLIPQARFTTTLLLLINGGLYVAMMIYSSKSGRGGIQGLDGYTLVNFGAMYPPLIQAGQWWRLITAGFLHGGIMHILMNSWVLFDLGAQTEEFFGTSRMLFIYFMSTVVGFWASAHFAHLSVGASAGIFGLIGAMIAFGVKERSSYGSALRSFYMRWAMYGLVLGFIVPNIDMAAHIGGLAAGFGAGFVAGTPRIASRTERVWQGIAALCVIITVLAFLNMFMGLARVVSQPGF